MKNKLILVLLSFSVMAFAKDYSFKDKVSKVAKSNGHYIISFQLQSARYKLLKPKYCLSKLEKSMGINKEITINFDPKTLEIKSCK